MMKSYLSDTEATEACVRLLHVMCCDVTSEATNRTVKNAPLTRSLKTLLIIIY